MGNIRPVEMMFLDDLFEMGGGFVLKFSDPTFRSFFADELGIDIDNAIYKRDGTSKGKRLRCFLQISDKTKVVRALHALWEYREAQRLKAKAPETIDNAHSRLLAIIARLEGKDSAQAAKASAKSAVDSGTLASLRDALIAVSKLDPQPRGYAFEKFLKELFDTFGLQAREPFRLRGEQIDGSFLLSNDIYLLEAKWQNSPCDGEALHASHGKLDQKAAWTRGLYLSNSGFTEDGLVAFGRAKRLICMDGLDLYDVLSKGLPLDQVLDRKVRRAAETGLPFVRVRDLFP